MACGSGGLTLPASAAFLVGIGGLLAPFSLPRPYAFELSTARYRAFGPDLANLWHEGGLHRVVAGQEVRITDAPGGVDVQPFSAEI